MSLAAGIAGSYFPATFLRHGKSGYGRLNPSAALSASSSIDVSLISYTRSLLHYQIQSTQSPFIAGHFNYCKNEFSQYKDEWSFVTVLREPIERWYSAYYFRRLSPFNKHSHAMVDIEEHFETEKGWEDSRSFVDFLTSHKPSQKELIEEDIYNVLDSLDSFSVVGFLNDTEAFCNQMKTSFERRLWIPKRNRRPKGSDSLQMPDINSDFHKKLQSRLEIEIEIYERAVERFKR